MKQLVLFSIITLISFTGCGGAMTADQAVGNSANISIESAPGGGGGGGGRGSGYGSGSSPKMQMSAADTTAEQIPETPKTPSERMIVRNADIRLESGSPEDAQTKISAAVESAGGFVIESSQSSSDGSTGRDTIKIKIRVPSEKFDATLAEIRKSADRVVIETVKGEDVTEEFVDVEARLNAKRALEQQFIEIMKRANTVEDALEVQTQLGDVRSEIERIEGRKRFLQDQAALSTISVEIRTPAAFAANSKGFSYRFVEALSNGFDFALDFILGLVSFVIGILPFMLFIVLPIFLIVRYFWRRRQKRKTAAEIIEEELSSET
jgi:hypothetical protein